MVRKHTCLLFLCLIGLITTSGLKAQDLDSLLNISAFTEESELQKILNKNLAVSAQKLTLRETPGIISIITAEEILNSGARDLIDILRLVPGFDVMQDLQFVMGLSLRGSWANEGKVLVMMDGIPFNELLYQSVAVGNRFPVDAIERIEIIRGPGSAMYGGSAEYGVINIISKAAKGINGVSVYTTAGLHADAIGRTNGGIMAGQKTAIFSWDISMFKGKGIVSDQPYQDIFQVAVPQALAEVTHADPVNVNVGLQYKSFSLRTLYDDYKTSDPFSTISFRNYALDMRYAISASSRLQITPRLQYFNQVPWKYDYADTPGADFNVRALRTLGQVDADYHVSRKVHLNFGGLYFYDKSIDLEAGEDLLTLNNFAFYSQALLKHRLFNATLGFRFEKNNRYDGAFVPRFGLTKKIENFHFKVLYSKSFRAPSLQNILLDTTGAKPERSNVFEFELGYQFTPEMLLAFNAFHITTRDIIIYGSSGEGDTFTEWYENYGKSGSQGVELVYSIRKKNWYAQATYSFSQALASNTVDKYVVPQTSRQYVGVPAHKITLNTNFKFGTQVSLNPSMICVGKRYAYTAFSDDGLISTELTPYLLANLFINYRPQQLKGLVAGTGVFDLFNQRPPVPQAYFGGEGAYAPIPARSREYVLKLSYTLSFKQ